VVGTIVIFNAGPSSRIKVVTTMNIKYIVLQFIDFISFIDIII
jgi:hypothetical protein